MNGALTGKPTFQAGTGRTYVTATRAGDLTTPGPVNIFVFLDEQADSIDDLLFMHDAGYAPGSEKWRNIPASYHNGSGSLSFADGHSDIHKWRSGTTKIGVTFVSPPAYPTLDSLGQQDYKWLLDRSAVRF